MRRAGKLLLLELFDQGFENGCGIADEICGIDKMPALYDYFAGRGFGTELLDKIFYTNALNFFENLA